MRESTVLGVGHVMADMDMSKQKSENKAASHGAGGVIFGMIMSGIVTYALEGPPCRGIEI